MFKANNEQWNQSRGIQVDQCDSDLLDKSWHLLEIKDITYAARNVKIGKKWHHELLHRTIFSRVVNRKLKRSERVDHKDGNGLNNKRENLRLATPAQNKQNSKLASNNKSGFKGVCKRKDKWQANINVNGKRIYLGQFTTPELAHAAYCAAADKYFKEFARYK